MSNDNDYDPLADESQSAVSEYNVVLIDMKDQTTFVLGTIEATSAAEAIKEARQRAWDECRMRKIEEKLLLIVTGDDISHSEEIDPNTSGQ